jgi:hypothetical protein
MRKMWVSTAMVGSPKAMFITTFAVLRPTPGSASSASRARHLAAVLLDQLLRQRHHVLRLGVEEPDGLNPAPARAPRRARPSLAGVSAAANSAGVSLLTPASTVAAAESTTATSSVNGLTCRARPRMGLAAWKRRNALLDLALVRRRRAGQGLLVGGDALLQTLTAAALPARALPMTALRRLSAVRRGALRGARRFLTGTARRDVFLRDAFLPDVLRAMFPV